MTTTKDTTNEVQRTIARVGLDDLTNWASDAVVPMINLLDATRLSPAAQDAWTISSSLFNDFGSRDEKDDAGRRVAYVLMLSAMIDAPEAVQAALVELRDQLVAADPVLVLIGRQVCADEVSNG